jgi:hypothetical protein
MDDVKQSLLLTFRVKRTPLPFNNILNVPGALEHRVDVQQNFGIQDSFPI